ncbi:hypothetical protein [Streptomyces sp. NPDC048606]|uniref:hypothetical protein n=1 Tax=Streptomyces sp. NPDC048606 TaxID=3154726 RepID=UPI003442887D
MVAPSPIPGLGSAAAAAASVITAHLRIAAAERAAVAKQDFDRAQAADRFGRELQLEAIRHLRQTELTVLQSELRTAEALSALSEKTLFDTYPVPEGPGRLRAALGLLADELADLPPLLLLPTFQGVTENHWSGLRPALTGALRRRLGTDGLVEVQDGLRAMVWPHAELYRNDLYGLPCLIVQVTQFRDTIDVGIGGCHLTTGLGQAPASPMRTIYRHRRRPPGHWTAEAIASVNSAAPASDALEVPGDTASHDRLEIEMAARAVTVVVTSAVDTYWLGSAVRYRQRFDDALALLGLTDLPDIPTDLGIPLTQVADPAHHLLTVARREAVRGKPDRAVDALAGSLAALVHPDYASAGPPYPSRAATTAALRAADPAYTEALRSTVEAVDAAEGPGRLDAADLPEPLAIAREVLRDQ